MEFSLGDLLIGVGIGIALAFQIMSYILRSVNKRLEAELDEAVKRAGADKTHVHATITCENGVYYMFKKDDNSFLAQGTTLTEIHDHLSTRFKNMVFTVDKIPEPLKKTMP